MRFDRGLLRRGERLGSESLRVVRASSCWRSASAESCSCLMASAAGAVGRGAAGSGPLRTLTIDSAASASSRLRETLVACAADLLQVVDVVRRSSLRAR